MAQETRDGCCLKEIRVVLDGGSECTIGLGHTECQIELCRVLCQRQRFQTQSCKRDLACWRPERQRGEGLVSALARLLEDKHGLEERGPTRVASCVQLLNEERKRVMLVCQSAQHCLTHVLQHCRKCWVPGEMGP